LKQPQLFYQSPNTIHNNITQLTKKFQKQGLTTKQYLQAALKTPSLFSQSPKAIRRHIRWIQSLNYLGIIKISERYKAEAEKEGIEPALYWAINNPFYVSLGEDNFKLRWCYAKLLNKPAQLFNLTKSKRKIQQELEKVFNTYDVDELRKIYKEYKKARS
ncbi:hypothetical protein DRJ22_02545, partial [Candidatus Woesearchaeota archaeon]